MRAHTSCLSLLIVVPCSVYNMPGERGHASNAWNKEASRKLDTCSGHWLRLDTSPECCAIHAPRALRASGVLGKEIKYYQNGPGALLLHLYPSASRFGSSCSRRRKRWDIYNIHLVKVQAASARHKRQVDPQTPRSSR